MERVTLTRRLMKFGSTGQIFTHLLFIIIVVLCLYPLALVIGISFTDETSLAIHGFKLVPLKTSLNAYSFVLKESDAILRAYGVTLLVTVMGTLSSTLVIALYAYALSRKDFRGRKFFSFIAFFTLLFSGGLVPWYMLCVNILHLQKQCLGPVSPVPDERLVRAHHADLLQDECARLHYRVRQDRRSRRIHDLLQNRHPSGKAGARHHRPFQHDRILERLVAAAHAGERPPVVQPSVPHVPGPEQYPVPVQHGGKHQTGQRRTSSRGCPPAPPRWPCASCPSDRSSWHIRSSRSISSRASRSVL